MPSPYATMEDKTTLWYEQSDYIATHIAAIGYGLHMSIFTVVTYYTIQRRNTTRKWVLWLIFNSTLFVLGTINLACNINFNESAWINERQYPGGPFHFLMEQQARPVFTLANSSTIVISFLVNGLLLYRVTILWNYTWYIVLSSAFFYIACVILLILRVIQIAIPGVGNIPNLSFPAWVVLMILDIFLSATIVLRLLLMRRRIKSGLGNEYAKPYAMLATLIVEAALPFTIVSVILLVLFGDRSTAQNLFIPLLIQVECIAPELITLRVILGNSWSNQSFQSRQLGTSTTWISPGAQGNSSVSDSIPSIINKETP